MVLTTPSGPCTFTLSNITAVPGTHLDSCALKDPRFPPEILEVCTLGKLEPEK
jgi:hypothetical protein